MSYRSWYEKHSQKHKNLVEKLAHLSDDELIDYFDFDNMVKHEIDFCPLYKDNKKCHDIEELNCYFCACPNFRVDSKKSFCNIDSKDGGTIKTKDFIHQDCSKCSVPHSKEYVRKHFSRDWEKVLKGIFL